MSNCHKVAAALLVSSALQCVAGEQAAAQDIFIPTGNTIIANPALRGFRNVTISEDARFLFAEPEGSVFPFDDLFLFTGDFSNFGELSLSGLPSSPDYRSVGTRLNAGGDFSYLPSSTFLLDANLSSGGGIDNDTENDLQFADQLLVGGDINVSLSGSALVTVFNTGIGINSTDLDGDGEVDPNEGLLFVPSRMIT